MKNSSNKETRVYNQSQGLGSWMLGYSVWDPFSNQAIFSRHQCLPAKITWIWIVCSAVQSGLQQESNDSDRQAACPLCVFNKYWTSTGVLFGFQGMKNWEYRTQSVSFHFYCLDNNDLTCIEEIWIYLVLIQHNRNGVVEFSLYYLLFKLPLVQH